MAYNRRSGGYGGYGSGGGAGGGGGGRFNGGGYRSGAAGTVNPWQSSPGAGGPMPRQPQQGGHHPPAQLALASNIISKLLTSSNSMPGNGYGGGPNRSGNWGSGGPRMAHVGMRQRQDGHGGFNKDNRRRGGDPHNRFSGGGRKSGGAIKDGEKRKSAGKVNDENKKGQNERERTKEQLDADKKASYAGVPSAVLYCHVCSKHMWDSESFEKHVRGRPHELMMTYLDEAYRMRVDYMRHQIKAVENQREIDLERVTNNKHKSNSGGNKTSGGNSNTSKPLLRSYCPMCDVRFYGPLTGHRKSDRHRKLKQFLHPECKLCDALFHTRLEMDEHKLTAGHLKKVAEIRNKEYPFLKDDEFDLIDMIKIEEEEQQDHDQMPVAKKYEMLGDRDATKLKLELEGGSGEKRRSEKKDSSIVESNVTATADVKNVENGVKKEENEEKDKEEESDLKEEEGNDLVQEEEMETSNVTSIVDDSIVEDTANELIKEENMINTDSATNKDNITANYDPNIAIGKDLLVPSKGYVCRLCNCFLLDEQRVSIHCQTAAHYINYTTMTKMKEAALSGKKRGIDQVVEDGGNSTQVDAENGDGIDNVVSQESNITESEEPAVKRIKLDSEENNEMDTSEQQSTEVESIVMENTPNVVEPVAEEKMAGVEQPAVASEAAPEVAPVAASDATPEAAPEVVPVAAPVTPTRGRGGRGRGGRGGVARRARR